MVAATQSELDKVDAHDGTTERAKIIESLQGFLESGSRIVQVCAVQALADLSVCDASLKRRLPRLLKQIEGHGGAAVRARVRLIRRNFLRR